MTLFAPGAGESGWVGRLWWTAISVRRSKSVFLFVPDISTSPVIVVVLELPSQVKSFKFFNGIFHFFSFFLFFFSWFRATKDFYESTRWPNRMASCTITPPPGQLCTATLLCIFFITRMCVFAGQHSDKTKNCFCSLFGTSVHPKKKVK